MKKPSKVVCGQMECAYSVSGDQAFTSDLQSNPFWDEYVVGNIEDSSENEPYVSVVQSRDLSYRGRVIYCDQAHTRAGIKFIAHHAETLRQEASQYTVHGNVILLGEMAVALVGGVSGIGKTSVASYATTRGHGWLSDEKFAMTDTAEYVQGLQKVLPDTKSIAAAKGMEPDAVCAPAKCRVGMFVIPLLTDEEKPTVHEYTPDKAEYHYYGELGRNITASCGLMRDFPCPLASADSELAATKRAKTAGYLSKHVPMACVRGNCESIVDVCETLATREG
ncbi:hypothetical protein CR983_01695 [Candidatus Saccharibacteria bacterium]|nr:MAG: hypothetical protein CR983_01695 [Candidatus Saccharibacteria bacterium]